MSSPDFIITGEYRRFEEFCDACFSEKYIGICYGAPGVGKTLSAKQYSKWDQYEGFDRPRLSKEDRLKMNHQLVDNYAIYYTVPVMNSPKQIEKNLNEWCLKKQLAIYEAQQHEPSITEDASLLIILDEADRLKINTLEQVRHMYDQGGLSIILIGMPGFEKRLSRYAQLYSRIGFAHQYRAMSKDEAIFILEHHWDKLGGGLDNRKLDDEEAIAAIIRITNGNFRLIHRLMGQIHRIMTINSLRSITVEVVVAARDCLVIGNT